MNKWIAVLISGTVAVLLVIGGACKTPAVIEPPVSVGQPSLSELQSIEEANKHLSLGRTYYSQEQWTEAITEFNRAAEIDPGEATCYWYLGEGYSKQKNYDMAIANYTKAIELYPKSRLMEPWQLSTVYLDRSISYDYKNDVSQAITDTTEAIKVDPKDDIKMTSLYYLFRGKYYGQLGLTKLAVADHKTVVQLGDPEYTQLAQKELNTLENSGISSESETYQSAQMKYYESSTFYFVYPNDWINITYSINEVLSNNPTLGLDQVAEVAYGIDEGNRGVYLMVGSNPMFNVTSIDECYDKNQMQSLGYVEERIYIDSQPCIVFKFQNPAVFTNQTKTECLKDGRLYWLDFISIGNKYYTQHEETYNIIMNSLKFK